MLNYIIIKIWWSIKNLIETINHAEKCAKIKGFNYNSNGQKNQGSNRKYSFKLWNGAVSLDTIHHHLQSSRFSKQEPFSATNATDYENVSQLLFLYRYHCNNGPERFHYIKKITQAVLAIKGRTREEKRGGRQKEKQRRAGKREGNNVNRGNRWDQNQRCHRLLHFRKLETKKKKNAGMKTVAEGKKKTSLDHNTDHPQLRLHLQAEAPGDVWEN